MCFEKFTKLKAVVEDIYLALMPGRRILVNTKMTTTVS
jgi:hypothetical protein